jgi:2-methylcitrate dehydratase PrpD
MRVTWIKNTVALRKSKGNTMNDAPTNLDASLALQKVTAFICDLPSHDVPGSARRMASLLLLDTLGICIAAAPMEAGILAREAAVRLYNSADEVSRATIMFDGRQASLAGASFATATQIDNLDGHDGYNPSKGHIGVAVVPALVAIAEKQPALSGLDALAALVISYEIAGRAGMALHGTVSDYHTSGAWNGLGVAALGARLRGASATQLREALGIAEYHGPRSQMMREIANPTMLHDGSGYGALVGMSAIIMAEMGFTGAPAMTVEAPEAASYWTDLGTFWQVEHQYVKPYPICRWAHAAIDAARELSLEHSIDPSQISRIEISSFHNAVQLFAAMPDSTSQAQYSLPFAVATMLVHGRIGLQHITQDAFGNAVVADLVDKTTLIESPHHEVRYPLARWADVVITMHDGRVLASGDVHARGGPERPYSEADIIAKFMEFAVPVVGVSRAEAICAATLGLSEPNSRFADLSQHLFAAP